MPLLTDLATAATKGAALGAVIPGGGALAGAGVGAGLVLLDYGWQAWQARQDQRTLARLNAAVPAVETEDVIPPSK